jgi:hypothetical protein
MLLFSSNQVSSLVAVPFPPFGLATISFLGTSSFLIVIGIYSTAISVAQDIQLRKSIRSFTVEQSRLLDSIGSAEMEQAIAKRVMALTKTNKDKMTEHTGIESSLSEDDMKDYMDKVMQEMQNHKTRSTDDKIST